MGAIGIKEKTAEPSLELQFANIRTRTPLGTEITLESQIRELPPLLEIPLAGDPYGASFINEDYYREKAKYLAKTSVVNPVGFLLKSTGPCLASL